jgi:hypothetical protein
MNVYAHPFEKTGLLRIRSGSDSEEKALAIKAALEDLPGVHAAEMTQGGVHLRFDPELVSTPQFYEAVTLAGFCASKFLALPDT